MNLREVRREERHQDRRQRRREMTPGARHAIWTLRLVVLALLVVVSLLTWRSWTEGDRVRDYFDKRICKIAERLYLPPAATADGKRRQAANRQFAIDVLDCTPPRGSR